MRCSRSTAAFQRFVRGVVVAGVLFGGALTAPGAGAFDIVVDDDFNGFNPATACIDPPGLTFFTTSLGAALAGAGILPGPNRVLVCPGAYTSGNALDRPRHAGLLVTGVSGVAADVRVAALGNNEHFDLRRPDITIEHLTLEAAPRDAVRVDRADRARLRDLVIETPASDGVEVRRSNDVVLEDLTVNGAGGAGVRIDRRSSAAQVLRVAVRNAARECLRADGDDLTVTDTRLDGCGREGLRLRRDRARVQRLTVRHTGRECVRLDGADDGLFDGLDLAACGRDAVLVRNGRRNTITASLIRSAPRGVVFTRNARDNTVSFSRIEDHAGFGLRIENNRRNTGNRIFDNCFTNPAAGALNARDDETHPAGNAFFDAASGRGNFWGPENGAAAGFSQGCADADANGICDTPFNVPGAGGSQDAFPLKACALGAFVAWYPMEEAAWLGVPGEVVDATGNGHDGTARNGPTTSRASPAIAGSPGTCRYGVFDGTDDHIEVPHDALLNGRTDLTYLAWVNADTWGGAQPIRQVMAKSVHGGGSGRAQMGVFSEGGVLKGRAETVSGRREVSVPLPPTGSWTHVALRFTPTTLTLFIDGVAQASTVFPRTTLVQTTDPLVIGKRVGTAQYFFDGLIDEVRVYTLRLSDADVAAIAAETHPCPDLVDHYRIGHDGFGIHCVAEPVAVDAVDAGGTPVAGFAGTITLDTGSGRGTWTLATGAGVLIDATPDDGLAQYTYAPADNGQASFLLSYDDGPSPINLSVSDGARGDDDSEGPLVFSPFGFLVDPIPSQTAGVPFTIRLTAFGQLPPNPLCGPITSYAGVKQLKLWSSYLDPATGTVPFTADGVPMATSEAAADALGGQPVTFANGTATVVLDYRDVGRVRIDAKDDSLTDPTLPDGIRGTSNPFVVRPADLVLSAVRRSADGFPNPGAADATGPVFIAAGDPFSVTVTAVDANGDPTPNYGREAAPESVALDHALLAPAGGNDPPIDAVAGFGAFAGGVASGSDFSWGEVGIVSLSAHVADGDYLGTGDVTGTATGPVGRFVPADFSVSIDQVPEFAPACGGFTYLGQPLRYARVPRARAVAVNRQGGTTMNYTGAFMKLDNAALAASGGKSYAAAVGAIDPATVPPDASDPVIGDLGGGAVSLTFGDGGGLAFQRAAPVAPLAMDIALSLDVVDADGVAWSANPLAFGAAVAGAGIAFTGASNEARWGRLRLENAFGSELAPLVLPIRAEHFDGSGFVLEAGDGCTPYDSADLSFAALTGLTSAPAATGAGVLIGGREDPLSPILLDSGGQRGSADATLSAPAWLDYDWDGDGNHDDDPTARVSFGLFAAPDALIYQREPWE